jgi:hypothetical protein
MKNVGITCTSGNIDLAAVAQLGPACPSKIQNKAFEESTPKGKTSKWRSYPE